MINLSSETFSTASGKKSEVIVRPADLYDNLPRERERKRERKRERERERERGRERGLKSTAADRNSTVVSQYSVLMLSSRRGHSIDVSNNIDVYPCGFFLQMLLKSLVFRTVSSFFIAIHGFSEISRKLLKKGSVI